MKSFILNKNHLHIIAIISSILLLCAPVLITKYPYGTDILNHLARQHIRYNINDVPFFEQAYNYSWYIVPNMAYDVLAHSLLHLFDTYTTAKVISIFGIILWVIGPVSLYYSIWNKLSIIPLLCVFFVFNFMYQWGFISGYITMGAAFCVMSLWIYCDKKSCSLPTKCIIFVPLLFAIYLGHLLFFLYLGFFIGLYNLGKLSASGKKIDLVELIRSNLIILFLFFPGLLHFNYLISDQGAQHGDTVTSSLFMDIGNIAQGMFSTPVKEVTIIVTTVLLSIAIFIFMCSQKLNKHLRVIPNNIMLYPLLGTALLVVIIPKHVLGVFLIGQRFVVLLAILLIVSFHYEMLSKHTKRLFVVLFTILSFIFLFQQLTLYKTLLDYDAKITNISRIGSEIKEGDKVFTLFDGDSFQDEKILPLQHSQSVLAIDRSAYIPSLFTGMGGFFSVTNTYKDISSTQASIFKLKDLHKKRSEQQNKEDRIGGYLITNWQDKYDYLLIINGSLEKSGFDSQEVELVKENADARLLRVLK